MDNGEKIKMHERMATVEAHLEQIMENHLPHLYTRINWVLGILITGLISIIFILLT